MQLIFTQCTHQAPTICNPHPLSPNLLLRLQAPVSGSKKPAIDGQLIILAAGDEGLFGECEAAFNAMVSWLFVLGASSNSAMCWLVFGASGSHATCWVVLDVNSSCRVLET
jgi:hypothetical protein